MRGTLLTAALLWAAPVRAGQNPGTTAAPILQVPMGSRAMGMGSAFTAVASDVSALYYNPAGLSRLNANEAAFTFMSGLTDNQLQHLAYGGPLPFTGITGNGYASLGASALFSQDGKIEVNRTNPDGSLASSENISAGSDFVGTLGYAERVGSTPIDYGDGKSYGLNHYLGLSAKYIRSTLVQTYSAQTFSADFGYLANSPEAGLTFGLAALNVGGQMKYADVADPLPTTLRAGAAYQQGISSDHALTLAADSEYLTREQLLHINTGLEYFWLRDYGFRIGYQFLQDNAGLTMGFGLRWHGRLMLDYAWAMSRSLSDSHRFTITYRFGGVAPSARATYRQPFIERAPEHEPIENLDEQRPDAYEPAPKPRATPRQESTQGVPGWIY